MQTVVASGTGKRAAYGGFAAGKTGTTEDFGDAWFVGFTKQMTIAVWVGYPDKLTPMKTEFDGEPVAGGTFPAQIWHDFVVQARRSSRSGSPTARPSATARRLRPPTRPLGDARHAGDRRLGRHRRHGQRERHGLRREDAGTGGRATGTATTAAAAPSRRRPRRPRRRPRRRRPRHPRPRRPRTGAAPAARRPAASAHRRADGREQAGRPRPRHEPVAGGAEPPRQVHGARDADPRAGQDLRRRGGTSFDADRPLARGSCRSGPARRRAPA